MSTISVPNKIPSAVTVITKTENIGSPVNAYCKAFSIVVITNVR